MKHVVFDLGAVLLTWQPLELVRRHLPEHWQGHDPAALSRELFHHADWLAFDQGLRTLEETAALLAARTGIPVGAIMAMIHVDGVSERLRPIEPTVDLLADLSARRDAGEPIRLYYLSNMPSDYARRLEVDHAFFSHFDGGVFSGDVKLLKPDPGIYRHLAERHALPGEHTLFIDDHLPNVQAARELGWHGVHFQSADALARELDDWLALAR